VVGSKIYSLEWASASITVESARCRRPTPGRGLLRARHHEIDGTPATRSRWQPNVEPHPSSGNPPAWWFWTPKGTVKLVSGLVAAKIGGRGRCIVVVQGTPVPAEIIAHCVWLYHRFPLSFREVEELMLQRGVVVSYETIRQWCAKFGQVYANRLRRRRARPGDKWHLDEVFIEDQRHDPLPVARGRPARQCARRPGAVTPNALAAIKFFRRLLKGLRYVPRVLVTDKLASYGPAHRVVMPSVEHRQSKYLNNRAENSHQPTRQRERAMKRFTSPRHAQRFLSAFSHISPHFRPRRHLLSATGWRHEMADRFTVWNQITRVSTTAA
jgi:putative transposase